MLGKLARPDRVVVADFEAGIGTVMRLDAPVDVIVIVVEPTAKSLEVGRRAAEIIATCDQDHGRVIVTANRVRDAEDEARVRSAFPDTEIVFVPDDPAIVDAERRGLAPIDAAPDAPAVRVLIALAESLSHAG